MGVSPRFESALCLGGGGDATVLTAALNHFREKVAGVARKQGHERRAAGPFVTAAAAAARRRGLAGVLEGRGGGDE